MSNLTIKVDVMAGTDLLPAIKEARELARTLNIAYVKISFNGVSISIGQDANIGYIQAEYLADNDGRTKHIVSA